MRLGIGAATNRNALVWARVKKQLRAATASLRSLETALRESDLGNLIESPDQKNAIAWVSVNAPPLGEGDPHEARLRFITFWMDAMDLGQRADGLWKAAAPLKPEDWQRGPTGGRAGDKASVAIAALLLMANGELPSVKTRREGRGGEKVNGGLAGLFAIAVGLERPTKSRADFEGRRKRWDMRLKAARTDRASQELAAAVRVQAVADVRRIQRTRDGLVPEG